MGVAEGRSVLVVSYRRCLQSVAFTGIFDFEDLICEWEDADLIELPAHRGRLSFDGPRTAYQGLRSLGVSTDRALSATRFGRKIVPPRDEYDLAIFVSGSIFDLFGISWLSHSLPSFKTSIAYTLEAWPGQLQPGPVDLEPLDAFDQIYVGLLDGCETLANRHGPKISFLPPAANVMRYPSTKEPQLLATNLGRTHPDQHEALRRAQAATGRGYQYDTITTLTARSVSAHRQAYADLVSSADLMVSNYAKFDQKHVIGSHHEVPMRLFEAIAASCVPIGESPSKSALEACDVLDTHRWEFPMRNDEGPVMELLADVERMKSMQAANRSIALLRHDWGHRWNWILQNAGLQATAPLQQRLDAMAVEAHANDSDHRGL